MRVVHVFWHRAFGVRYMLSLGSKGWLSRVVDGLHLATDLSRVSVSTRFCEVVMLNL